MKKIFTFLVLIITFKSFAQKSETIRLSDFKLCELTVDYLKEIDSNLRQVQVEEMNLLTETLLDIYMPM